MVIFFETDKIVSGDLLIKIADMQEKSTFCIKNVSFKSKQTPEMTASL